MRTKWSAVQMIEQLRLARHTCTSIVKLLLSMEGLLNYGLSGGGLFRYRVKYGRGLTQKLDPEKIRTVT